jgi:hypothetical protein
MMKTGMGNNLIPVLLGQQQTVRPTNHIYVEMCRKVCFEGEIS